MELVAHFDFKLHQMDVKSTFLNDDLTKKVYMKQHEGFSSSDGEHLECKLNKSIYGLKQASRQCYLKFHKVITSFSFEENIMDNCIYLKVNGNNIMDNFIWSLLHLCSYIVKQFLLKNLDMKNMGDSSYVIGIKIHRKRSQGILVWFQETYINKVLERFNMKDCSPSDKLNLSKCRQNDFEQEHMKNISYASIVGSFMYAQVCTRPDIAY
ncbi:hypothetical protein CR513_22637, partial [Mucuna pruriens]